MMETQLPRWEHQAPRNEEPHEEAGILGLILEFLETPGQVLLVRGAPGTGKTTLCLELLRRVVDVRKVYASSRVSPTKLRNQFPWIDIVTDPVSGRTSGLVLEPASESAKNDGEIVDLTRTETDYVVYRIRALMRMKARTVMVVDSWEGALKGEKPGRTVETAIVPELNESTLSLVLVSEEGDDVEILENAADGIIRLSTSEPEGRRVRTISVEKLRGFKVPLKRMLFSLDGGRFTPLASHEPKRVEDRPTQPFPVVPHDPGFYSTGSQDLDRLLGNGGLRRGSFLLLETDETTTPSQLSLFLSILGCNFVSQGGCAFMLPYATYSSENIAETIRPHVGDHALGERVRVGEYDTRLPPAKYRVPLIGKAQEDLKTFTEAWTTLGGSSSPKLLTTDFDLMQVVYGEEMRLFTLQQIGARMRDDSALVVGLASNRNKVLNELRQAADYHLVMSRLEDSLCIYGVKPLTPVSGATFTSSHGFPSMNLVQVA